MYSFKARLTRRKISRMSSERRYEFFRCFGCGAQWESSKLILNFHNSLVLTYVNVFIILEQLID